MLPGGSVFTLFERDKPMSYLYQSRDNKLDLTYFKILQM